MDLKRFALPLAFALILVMIPDIAVAQFCKGLAGCGIDPAGLPGRIISFLYETIKNYALLLAGLLIIFGGLMIMLGAGNEERVNTGKNTIIWTLVGLFAINFAAEVINILQLEIGSIPGGPDLPGNVIRTLTGSALTIVNTALFGVIMYCGMTMVLSQGKEDQFTKARTGLLTAAIGAVIINLGVRIIDAVLSI